MIFYKNLKDYAEKNGIHRETASRRLKNGKLKLKEVPKGYKYYIMDKKIMIDLKFRILSPRENAKMEYHDFADYSDVDQLGFTPGYDKVMQYTGLKDKNGVEIYEGDIIELAGYGQYEVEFPFIELYEAAAESDILGIIGNIYENKDLLNNS